MKGKLKKERKKGGSSYPFPFCWNTMDKIHSWAQHTLFPIHGLKKVHPTDFCMYFIFNPIRTQYTGEGDSGVLLSCMWDRYYFLPNILPSNSCKLFYQKKIYISVKMIARKHFCLSANNILNSARNSTCITSGSKVKQCHYFIAVNAEKAVAFTAQF